MQSGVENKLQQVLVRFLKDNNCYRRFLQNLSHTSRPKLKQYIRNKIEEFPLLGTYCAKTLIASAFVWGNDRTFDWIEINRKWTKLWE